MRWGRVLLGLETEERPRQVVKDIDDIRAGLWDDRIRHNAGVDIDVVETVEPTEPTETERAVAVSCMDCEYLPGLLKLHQENVSTDDVLPAAIAADILPEATAPPASGSRRPTVGRCQSALFRDVVLKYTSLKTKFKMLQWKLKMLRSMSMLRKRSLRSHQSLRYAYQHHV